MQLQGRRETQCELQLRRELHALGARYYVHRRPLGELRCEADLLFPRRRVAIFVDGCFWHGCRTHKKPSKTNAKWWRAKIERTVERDAETSAQLVRAGWTVVRVWEHTLPQRAAARIGRILDTKSSPRIVRL